MCSSDLLFISATLESVSQNVFHEVRPHGRVKSQCKKGLRDRVSRAHAGLENGVILSCRPRRTNGQHFPWNCEGGRGVRASVFQNHFIGHTQSTVWESVLGLHCPFTVKLL